jgi:hypothetical protein
VRKREFSLPILTQALLASAVQMFGTPHALDQSRWRWETKGPPLQVARLFRAWLASEEPDPRVGRTLASDASWPTWEQMPPKRRQGIARPILHWLDDVYYPADGMAYVHCPLLHPDQDEPIEIPAGGVYPDPYVITLLLEDGEWRVHAIGLRHHVPPQALGREPYSW